MHEVAEPRPGAFQGLVLTARGFPVIGDRGQVRKNGSTVEPALVESFDSLAGRFFGFECYVNISQQVVTEVLTDVHLFNPPVFLAYFPENLLVELLKFQHVLAGSDHLFFGRKASNGGCVCLTDVEVFQENGLTESWHRVQPGTFISVAACPSLVVEGTVDFVLFSPVNGSQILGHCCFSSELLFLCYSLVDCSAKKN